MTDFLFSTSKLIILLHYTLHDGRWARSPRALYAVYGHGAVAPSRPYASCRARVYHEHGQRNRTISIAMTPLPAVRAANASYAPAYIPHALFVGGTSGVGQAMAEAFARYTKGNAHIILCGLSLSVTSAPLLQRKSHPILLFDRSVFLPSLILAIACLSPSPPHHYYNVSRIRVCFLTVRYSYHIFFWL